VLRDSGQCPGFALDSFPLWRPASQPTRQTFSSRERQVDHGPRFSIVLYRSSIRAAPGLGLILPAPAARFLTKTNTQLRQRSICCISNVRFWRPETLSLTGSTATPDRSQAPAMVVSEDSRFPPRLRSWRANWAKNAAGAIDPVRPISGKRQAQKRRSVKLTPVVLSAQTAIKIEVSGCCPLCDP
jgi:hypothetical protein